MVAPTPRVLDGHNDTLLDIHLQDRGGGRTFFERSTTGHVDLPRATDAGYGGAFFAIFVPGDGDATIDRTDDGYAVPYADSVDPSHAKSFTYELLARLHRTVGESGGRVRIATDTETVRECIRRDDSIAAIPHLEGAAAIEPDRSNLEFLYAAGVRSIGLVWSRPNAFAHGVPFRYPETPDVGPGLSEAGLALADACEDRGILVDLAHLNEAGFWDVAERTRHPLVVSHAGVHDICPSTRNLTDGQLDAIAESNGVVGISLAVENLRADGEQVTDTPVSAYVDHVEYVADRVGVDHVAIGSDFDGCTIPDSIGDVTGLQAIRQALRERGFSEGDLERLCHGNWLRVLEATWTG